MSQTFLSVIIPAFCEGERIGETLTALHQYLSAQQYSYEIIVVNDGSTDNTTEVVKEFQKSDPCLHLVHHDVNKGKGAAIRTGMQHALGMYALFDDADNATPITELPKLLEAAERGCDIVIGSRYLPGSEVVVKQSILRRLMSRAGNLLFRVLLGLDYTDTRCGFKLFNERARIVVFSRQQIERWGFDTEILVIAKRHMLQVQEVPVQWYDKTRSNVKPVRDSLRALQEIAFIRKKLKAGSYD